MKMCSASRSAGIFAMNGWSPIAVIPPFHHDHGYAADPGAKEAIIGLETSDLDEFVARLKHQSVKFVLDTLATPVCRMAVVEDPDGNHLIIHKRHEGSRSA
jgi:hypothetical protein